MPGQPLPPVVLIDLSRRAPRWCRRCTSHKAAKPPTTTTAIVAALADGDNALAGRLMLEHIDTLAARLDASRAGNGNARLGCARPGAGHAAAGIRATQRRQKMRVPVSAF